MRNTNGLIDQKKSYRIEHKTYDLYYNSMDENYILIPRTKGDIVRNWPYSAIQYYNAGKIYKAAVKKLKEIISEMEKE